MPTRDAFMNENMVDFYVVIEAIFVVVVIFSGIFYGARGFVIAVLFAI
jgi:hypothetical protein